MALLDWKRDAVSIRDTAATHVISMGIKENRSFSRDDTIDLLLSIKEAYSLVYRFSITDLSTITISRTQCP